MKPGRVPSPPPLGATEARIVDAIAATFREVPLQNSGEEWESLIHSESHMDAVALMTRWFASLTFSQQLRVIEKLAAGGRR